ncbi:MAG: hypothetical protein IPN79_19735 [Saprospiraceae bacterium]|nr:hypothetical protein [Saprospiraceae bacterium]
MLTGNLLTGQSCETLSLVHYNYNDIKIILEKNACQNCHFKGNPNAPWSFETYESLTSKGKCGPVIEHGKPQKSLLVDKLNQGSISCGLHMPLGGEGISSRDLLAIEMWILLGAPEFCIPEFDEVKTILDQNDCASCHQDAGQWRYDSYTHFLTKPANSLCDEKIVVPFDQNKSLLYQKITGFGLTCGERMFSSGQPVPYVDMARIRDWINSGAFQSSPTLPVVLTDFSAELKSDNSVLLYWQSSAEFNTAYYAVEHSGDGIHFEESGVRQAVAQNDQLTNYEWYDYAPLPGNQYYRLKIVDHDGQFSYSQTRAVRIKNTTESLKLYPSSLTAGQPIYIEWLTTKEYELTRIFIMDILGREVFTQIISPGINTTQIPHLHPGLYYVSIPEDFENYFVKKMFVIY